MKYHMLIKAMACHTLIYVLRLEIHLIESFLWQYSMYVVCYTFQTDYNIAKFSSIFRHFLVFMMLQIVICKRKNVKQMCNFTTDVSSNFLLHKLISFIVMHYMPTPQKFFNLKTNFWKKSYEKGSDFLHSTAQK